MGGSFRRMIAATPARGTVATGRGCARLELSATNNQTKGFIMSDHDQDASTTPGSTLRTLRRSTSDRMLGGVCGGLAQHFGIDPALVRIAFVLLAIAGSTGVLLYLLLWAMVPEEGSDRAFGHRFGLGRRP